MHLDIGLFFRFSLVFSFFFLDWHSDQLIMGHLNPVGPSGVGGLLIVTAIQGERFDVLCFFFDLQPAFYCAFFIFCVFLVFFPHLCFCTNTFKGMRMVEDGILCWLRGEGAEGFLPVSIFLSI
ncbi:hypothetical protein J3E68DRAFT_374116 [Trichoderma sp. SZMC 28012]